MGDGHARNFVKDKLKFDNESPNFAESEILLILFVRVGVIALKLGKLAGMVEAEITLQSNDTIIDNINFFIFEKLKFFNFKFSIFKF